MKMAVLILIFSLFVLLTAWAVAHILLNKRDPRGAALWIAISLFLPGAGPFLYWVLGINRVRRRTVGAVRRRAAAGPVPAGPSVYPALESASSLTGLMRISESITRDPLLSGNSIEALVGGNRAFPAMLTAIGGSRRSINLSTYILDRDAVGLRTVSALCAAADRGIEVRVLVDGVGTSYSAIAMARRLKDAGASLAIFHPLFGLPVRRPGINMRNHRKLLIVDGEVGFTGGLNITSRHLLTPWKKKAPIRDIHFRITGPILERMQSVFAQDWHSATEEQLAGKHFFPGLDTTGEVLARAVPSGPDEDMEKIYQLILGALRSAREHVMIMTPYFIPDRALVQALTSAVLAGVRVDLLLPETSDHPLVQRASMAYLTELLENGVRVSLVPPPFVHSKLMVVDGSWSLIGSANLDPRSFRLNFELDLEIYSRKFSGEMLDYARNISSEGRDLDLETVKARPLFHRLLEGALKIFSPYL